MCSWLCCTRLPGVMLYLTTSTSILRHKSALWVPQKYVYMRSKVQDLCPYQIFAKSSTWMHNTCKPPRPKMYLRGAIFQASMGEFRNAFVVFFCVCPLFLLSHEAPYLLAIAEPTTAKPQEQVRMQCFENPSIKCEYLSSDVVYLDCPLIHCVLNRGWVRIASLFSCASFHDSDYIWNFTRRVA